MKLLWDPMAVDTGLCPFIQAHRTCTIKSDPDVDWTLTMVTCPCGSSTVTNIPRGGGADGKAGVLGNLCPFLSTLL